MGVRVKLLVMPMVVLVTLLAAPSLATPLVAGNVATNEILDAPPPQEESELDLAYCRSGSACGYVQVNAYGVSSKNLCRCPSLAGPCSLRWDPQDGHSVTMGSEQYKFCGSPPPMSVCGLGQHAYTAAYVFDSATFSMVAELHRLHCFCPAPLQHVRQDMIDDHVDGEMIMGTRHTCSRLPMCSEEDPCKEVTVSGEKALVYLKCRCPKAMSCPTLGLNVVPSSNSYPRGASYSVFCQRRY